MKYRDIVDRDFRTKGRRQREDDGREKRCLEEKYREGNRSSDRSGNKCGFERMREITVEKKPSYVLVAWKSLLCFLTKLCDFEVKGSVKFPVQSLVFVEAIASFEEFSVDRLEKWS
ncbi:hypothetical protein NC653_001048 [Populus alba x Populus x berolinensis]|uniref:Uncharacterized protein n=1 Tax=Populus alba x Populus x berolinensis TaxID=444605 RepID=A0AAD6RK35_9ROSI|nr:hypothetical protein NC653_001048 [Populus alba x Populus x berolinensis]